MLQAEPNIHTLDKGMMPIHFHLQGQPWKFHNTSSSLNVKQPLSTMFLLTTKLFHNSENEKQQQQNLLNTLPITR